MSPPRPLPLCPAASVSVRGERAEGWAFHLHDLGAGHHVAVARAPPSAVVDAWGGFAATFQQTAFAPAEWAQQLAAPEPAFAQLAVADLLAPAERAQLRALQAEA